MKPLIVAVMPTLGRPWLVEQSLRMFEMQTYAHKFLLILDTGDQISIESGKEWAVVRTGKTDDSLGTTLNRGIRATESEMLCSWDDDDQYFPWHLEACAAALSQAWWACPSLVYDHWEPQRVILTKTSCRPDRTDVDYHGCWSFRRDAFEAVGGYPEDQVQENENAFKRLLGARFGSPADTISDDFPMPSYLYSRSASGADHASETTDEYRLSQRRKTYEPWTRLIPRWPQGFMQGLPMNATPCERMW